MKKTISSIIALMMIFSTGLKAQKEFTKLYEIKFPLAVDSWQNNDDQTVVIAGNKGELCSIDAVTGKTLWQFTIKDKFGVKKSEDWDYDVETGLVSVKVKGEKKDEEITYYIDDRTGEKVSDASSRKPREVKTGRSAKLKKAKKSWVGKGDIYLDDPDVILSLEYESPKINSSFQRDKKFPITVSSSGANNWKTTVQGSFVRSLCDNMMGYGDDFGGDFIDMSVSGNYIFVVYEGLSVLDLTTGKLLWETTFDFSSFDFGMMKSEMIIGRAPMPISDATGAYIADLSKDSRSIRKFDLKTGKLLWETERLKKDAIITEMMVIDGVLVVRNGGKVLVQTLVTNANDGSQTCRSEMKEEGSFNLVAYDINTGKQLWNGDDVKELGDKFKSISNLLSDGKLLYVTSDRNIFAIDPKTGAPRFKTDVDGMKVGKPQEIFFYEDDIVIDAEEGLARVKKADGSKIFATNTKKNLGSFVRGDVLYVWIGKDTDDLHQFVRFNITTGAIEGMVKDTYHPYFTADGNEFIRKKDSTLTRYKTN